MSPSRYFTLDEANALLPLVREKLGVMRDSLSYLQQNGHRLGLPGRSEAQRWIGDQPVPAAYAMALTRLAEAHGELDSEGVQIKDVISGLVDFPALDGDQVVLLCWKDGEDRIGWFHDLQSGFAGRRPIDELTQPS